MDIKSLYIELVEEAKKIKDLEPKSNEEITHYSEVKEAIIDYINKVEEHIENVQLVLNKIDEFERKRD
jgi:hypothetical protein